MNELKTINKTNIMNTVNELNFIFGDIKSQLDDLVNEAKKIDEKKLKEEEKL